MAPCTCATFDCEPDVPVTTATPYGFACDDLTPADPLFPSCRQYAKVQELEATVARLEADLVAARATTEPGAVQEPPSGTIAPHNALQAPSWPSVDYW